jgi:phytoene dehydrogenase-like protein
MLDAVVVGAGPNGLAAAIVLVRAGARCSCSRPPRRSAAGRGLPSSRCPASVTTSARGVHPLAAASPLFRRLPLAEHGLEWVHPPALLAHPFDDGAAAVLERSLEETAASLGPGGPA